MPAFRAELCQYPTPPPVAARMVQEWAPLFDGATVLEPSAGSGNLVQAALDGGARAVMAVEIDAKWCRHLRKRFDGRPVTVIKGDFLDCGLAWRSPPGQPLDVVLTNPPYDEGLDTDHLERIVGIAPHTVGLFNASVLHGREHWDRIWSRVLKHRGLPRQSIAVRNLVQRPPYLGNGGRRDAAVVRFGNSIRDENPLDWWPEAWWAA